MRSLFSALARARASFVSPRGEGIPSRLRLRRERGLTIPETLAVIALFTIFVVFAYVGGGAALQTIRANALERDVRLVAGAAIDLYSSGSTYEGLDEELIAGSELLPDNLVDGIQIILTDSDGGDLEILGMGAGSATVGGAVGAGSPRAFWIVFGIETNESCQTIAGITATWLRGVQVLAPGATAPIAGATTPTTGNADLTAGMHFEKASDRRLARLADWCQAASSAAPASLALGFR